MASEEENKEDGDVPKTETEDVASDVPGENVIDRGELNVMGKTRDISEFTDFVDGALPRTFVATAALNRSATGAQILSGTPYATKFI